MLEPRHPSSSPEHSTQRDVRLVSHTRTFAAPQSAPTRTAGNASGKLPDRSSNRHRQIPRQGFQQKPELNFGSSPGTNFGTSHHLLACQFFPVRTATKE